MNSSSFFNVTIKEDINIGEKFKKCMNFYQESKYKLGYKYNLVNKDTSGPFDTTFVSSVVVKIFIYVMQRQCTKGYFAIRTV